MRHSGARILRVDANFGDGGNRRFSVDPTFMATDSSILFMEM